MARAVRRRFDPGVTVPGNVRVFAPGETVARRGERVDALFRLGRGRVQVRASPGRAVAVAEMPGLILGGGGTLLDRRAATLVAETEVEAERIPLEALGLSHTILRRPGLGLALAESLALRLTEVGHGLRVVDDCLASLEREVEEHAAAFATLVDGLAARGGRLRVLAAEARGRPTYRRGVATARERKEARAAFAGLVHSGEAGASGVELSAGEFLTREGEPSRDMFLVISGELQVVSRGRTLDELHEGEIAGAVSALLWGRRSARPGEETGAPAAPGRLAALRASRPSRVLRIPGEALAEVAAGRPAIAVNVVRIFSRRLERAYSMLAGVEEALARAVDALEPNALEANALESNALEPNALEPSGSAPATPGRPREGSLAEDYEKLGGELSAWADEVPEAVRETGRRLVSIRRRARRARAAIEEREGELLRGVSFREILGRHEFASAEACVRRVMLRLGGRGSGGREGTDGSSGAGGEEGGRHGDSSDDLFAAAEAVVSYAALGCDYHWRIPRPHDLESHSVAVAVWSLGVAGRLGYAERDARTLALAALLHDVGMLRAGRATPSPREAEGAAEAGEFRMDRHATEYAAPYLARLKGLPAGIVPAICQHHEFVDGSGYPRRLTGGGMSRDGKVLSAANRLDLLLRKGLALADAVAAMRSEAERYDPEVLAALVKVAREATAQAGTE